MHNVINILWHDFLYWFINKNHKTSSFITSLSTYICKMMKMSCLSEQSLRGFFHEYLFNDL